MEIWVDIPGYEGKYKISNQGNVLSLNYRCTGKPKLLKQGLTKAGSGYYIVNLPKNGKYVSFYVHLLVWQSFNGPIPEGMQVNHLNEISTDNRLENLNLLTQRENLNWGTCRERISKKLKGRYNGKTSKPVAQYTLDGKLIQVFPSAREAERQTGVNNWRISNVCTGRRKKAGGFIWRFYSSTIQ